MMGSEKEGQWPKLLIGLVAVFVLFHWIASVLGSDRGQSGILIGLIVVVATIAAERLLFGKSFAAAILALGLGVPAMRGLLTAVAISGIQLLSIPVFASVMDASFSFYPGWLSLIPGLFFQGGIGEETLFRGYLFGHLRQRYSFGKAAMWSMLPFTAVHLILFFSMSWPIALASILLALVMSFPLARLFELGGKTIWAPAIVHFVVQGLVKVVVVSGESAGLFPVFWMIVCAVVPLCAFCIPIKRLVLQSS